MNKLIQAIEQAFNHSPTNDQQTLISKFADFVYAKDAFDCFLLQGYAGTGKTTMVSALVKVLPQVGYNAVLLAPTGRAAKVLSSYSNQRAYTLHKHLYKSEIGEFGTQVILKENKAKKAIFIVDEVSMLPTETSGWERNLMNDLFEFVSSGFQCKLVLVGDDAQLPPVGEEDSPIFNQNFLRTSFHVQLWHHKLTEVVRQDEQSGILLNATALRLKLLQDNTSLPLFDLEHTEDVVAIDGLQLEDTLNSVYGKYGIEDVAVICRSNKEANQFNNEIRKRILFKEEEISAGDLLMVVKNNYFWLAATSKAGFIANGDMIEVLKVRKIEEQYGFRFADATIRLIDYTEEKELDVKLLLNTLQSNTASLSQEELKTLYNSVMDDYQDIPSKQKKYSLLKQDPFFNALQIKYAYALTCHKTQGGQWEQVIVSKGFLKEDMIDKSYLRWLYTAITRAKKKLYLLNFNDVFYK